MQYSNCRQNGHTFKCPTKLPSEETSKSPPKAKIVIVPKKKTPKEMKRQKLSVRKSKGVTKKQDRSTLG